MVFTPPVGHCRLRLNQSRAPRPVSCGPLKGMGDLEHAPLVVVAPYDLEPDGQAGLRKAGGHGNRWIRHERDVPARADPIHIVRHRYAGHTRRVPGGHIEWRDLRHWQHEVVVALDRKSVV